MRGRPGAKNGHHLRTFQPSHAERLVCCALAVRYNIYSTVGQSIASIYDLGGIFTLALRASENMAPQVVYISYRPPYHTIYIT